MLCVHFIFFFQAEDGIRDSSVTGVQTCALPIYAMEALHETMKANSVNEQQALTQLDKVLDSEREMKRLHIGMDIRIKNQLTPEQQAKLLAMHQMRMGPDGPNQGPGGRGGDRPLPRTGPPPPPGQCFGSSGPTLLV